MRGSSSSGWSSSPAVGVVTLEGEITGSGPFVDAVQRARDDDSIVAVVVRINSPGGQVAPSQEMYEALRELSEVKPTVASLGSVAASGGYYVAAAANTVVANRGSLTGSVGVILSLTNVSGLMEKLGVKSEVVTAGRLKDMGSPFRPSSPSERAIFQAMADEIHQQFIDDVKAVRPLTPDQIAEVSTGRIFTGEAAVRIGLVDQLGGFEDAIRMAAEQGGIEDKPRIVHFSSKKGPWWLNALMEQSSATDLPRSLAGLLATFATARDDAGLAVLFRLPLLTEGFETRSAGETH
ncbi:MAG: signal peptide peptidase SppA [Deltaproteobacteria bacterium]